MRDRSAGLDATGEEIPAIDGVLLDELLKSDNAILAKAVQRVTRAAESQQNNYAAFGNSPESAAG